MYFIGNPIIIVKPVKTRRICLEKDNLPGGRVEECLPEGKCNLKDCVIDRESQAQLLCGRVASLYLETGYNIHAIRQSTYIYSN